MTSSLLSWPPLPIPITTQSRQRSHPENGEAYLYRCNLATAAIASYLQMIAVPHRIETSSSGTQLYVEELGGYVACCPVFPNEQKCEVLDHERANCKGFLFVELSDPYYQAYVLGFVREVSVRELPLSYLQPLSAFTVALEEAERASQSSRPQILIPAWIVGRISGWLSPQERSFTDLSPSVSSQNRGFYDHQSNWAMRGPTQHNSNPLYERYASAQGNSGLVRSLSSMEPITALATIVEHTTSDAIRWQAAEQLAYINSTHPLSPSLRVKSLVDDLAGLAVALLVGVMTKSDGTFLIGCRLYATGAQPSLPTDIVLKGIDEATPAETATDAQVFCEITPTVHGDPLEYLFTAENGDRFSFHIHYQGHTSTSTFVLPATQSLSEKTS
ncbi:MAG: Protein of unknown function (DUF1822) [Phormidesmis priestleyi Ana]|uniref:Uncharacterized protein n=1 Tax=Phormidesmis priestleyi Ana TaxID=1666911 RepID=A0A0N8KLV7_9CYAN|nr:MAG: Protein of unknown function (DUF1822) [Phormidesmis priestleyi Ana]